MLCRSSCQTKYHSLTTLTHKNSQIHLRYTTFIGIAIEIPFALGEMLLGLEAYYIRDWRTLQMVAYLPLLALLVLWWLVPESPRYVNEHTLGRDSQEKKLLEKFLEKLLEMEF